MVRYIVFKEFLAQRSKKYCLYRDRSDTNDQWNCELKRKYLKLIGDKIVFQVFLSRALFFETSLDAVNFCTQQNINPYKIEKVIR